MLILNFGVQILTSEHQWNIKASKQKGRLDVEKIRQDVEIQRNRALGISNVKSLS